MQRSNSRHRRKRDRHERDHLQVNLNAANVNVGGSLGGGSLGGVAGKRGELLDQLLKSHGRSGVVTNEEVARIAGELQLGHANVFGVATFYSLLAPTKANQRLTGETGDCRTIHICDGPACRLSEASLVFDEADSTNLAERNEQGPCLRRCSCPGLCDAAPAVLTERNDGTLHAAVPLTPDDSIAISAEEPLPYPSPRNALPRDMGEYKVCAVAISTNQST